MIYLVYQAVDIINELRIILLLWSAYANSFKPIPYFFYKT